MSKKIRRPAKNVVPIKQEKAQQQFAPLGGDASSLVTEWRRLQGILAQVQVELNKRQETINQMNTEIASLQQNGLQINGAAQMVLRLLTGMGVDPNKYVIPEEVEEDEDDSFESGVCPDTKDNVVEPKEVTRSPRQAAIRRRFNH